MGQRLPWIGRVLGALGVLLGFVVGMRYLVTTAPSNVFLGLGLTAIVLVAAWIYLDWDLVAGVAGRRGTQRQAGSWLMVLFGLGIVVLLNFMGTRHYWEKDITEGGIHSLSQQTLDVLEALDEPVAITGFYRQIDSVGDAPRQRETFRKLSERLQLHSDQLTVELIDPDVEPRVAIDRSVFQNGVVFLECGDREERVILPDENDLSNALIKVTRSGRKSVYFLAGHGEHGIQDLEGDGYSELRQKLSQTGFQVSELELFREGAVPDDADALVIAGPTKPLLETEVPLIRDFVERRGGGLLVLLNPETVSGLDDQLQAWGIEVGQDLVVDVDPMRLTLVGDYTTIFADLAYHEITEELQVPAILSGVRTVVPEEGRPHTRALLRSGKAAWAETDLESLEAAFDAEVDELGPVDVAAVTEVEIVGVFTVDPAVDDDSAAGTADERAGHDHGGQLDLDDGADERRAPVIVFGDSDFAANGSLSLFGNSDLVLNSVSYLVHEEDLITIRARDEEDRPLMLTGLQRTLVMVVAVPGMTLAVIAAGVIAWIRRLAR